MSLLPAPQPGDLHTELRTLIASSRQRLAGAVNTELTRLYWTADQLGQLLSQEFGRGFEARNHAPHGEVCPGVS